MSSDSTYGDAEVVGKNLRSIVNVGGDLSSVFEKRIEETLAEYGINDIRADEWYPLDRFLDALAVIEESVGEQMLTNMGKNIPDSAEWPPSIDSVDEALASLDDAYQLNHRGDEIGSYEYESAGDAEALMTCRNPYPCDFDRGLIAGVAEKFSSAGTLIEVEEVGDTCRSDGDEECVYRVVWQ